MAYVPDQAYDLFLSYAHNDSLEWIRALEESLRQELRQKLGSPIEIWRDEGNLRFGQKWDRQIVEGLKGTAALLALVSPSYRRSEWCDEERNTFLEHCEATKQSMAGPYYRFLKAIKTPWPQYDHELWFADNQHIDFFEPRGKKDEPIPETFDYLPGSQEFRTAVNKAAHSIASLLEQMRRNRQPVFLAGVARDGVSVRESLRNELEKRGHDVRPAGNPDRGYSPTLINKALDGALLSVHVLGATHADFVETQIKLAFDAGKRLVFWITREAENTQDVQQRNSIELIYKGEGAYMGCEWLNSRSAQGVAEYLMEKLRPSPQAAAANGNGVKRIYLLCDPTTQEDAGFASELQEKIIAQEHMKVELPVMQSTGMAQDRHQKLLGEADGLLLYRKAAPVPWLLHTATDVIYAETLSRRQKLCDAKGFLLGDPSVLAGSPVPLFRATDGFSLGDIEPFLARLRAGSAHAA